MTSYIVQIVIIIKLNGTATADGKVNPLQHIIGLRAFDIHCVGRCLIVNRHIRRRSLYIAASVIQLRHHINSNRESLFIRRSITKRIISIITNRTVSNIFSSINTTFLIDSAFTVFQFSIDSITASHRWFRSRKLKF